MTAPLLLFGGKGGVGKTTLAAATAWRLAEEGARVLLVSTDPAHSTADLLGADLADQPTRVQGSLWALEIDAGAQARCYVDGILADAETSVSPEVMPALERHLALALQAPGTLEAALFDRICDLITGAGEDFDHVVFDTAPSGHTLRLLSLPDMLGSWVAGLRRQREKVTGLRSMWRNLAGREPDAEDPVLARLRDRARRYRVVRQRLQQDAAFRGVLTAERLPIEETARLLTLLSELEVPVDRLYLNRLLPAGGDDPYLQARRARQTEYETEIRHRFAAWPLTRVELAAGDIHDRTSLAELAASLAP